MHTGRSRNDQVATAFRMTVRDELQALQQELRALQAVLAARAAAEIDTLMPAYTHWQRAQPVRLAHWILAHFWALDRDVERLHGAHARTNVLPLGSGAATGNAFGIDREQLAAELGFARPCPNSIDAVGDRDFALESAFACTTLALHLSRIAEELVLWSTTEFGFVVWPDDLATGSSLMPNKKNPDLAELVRGRSAGAVGDLVALLTLIKSLPAGYQRDLQDDKPPVWRLFRSVRTSTVAMTAAFTGLRFDAGRMRAALSDDLFATEVADRLVARGIPFRDAHAAVAAAAAKARAQGTGMLSLDAAALQAPLTTDDLRGTGAETAVERRSSTGGTARAAVLAQLAAARAQLGGAA